MWKQELSLHIFGDPKAQPRARKGKAGNFYTPDNGKAWRDILQLSAQAEWRGRHPLLGSIKVDALFLFRGGEAGKFYTKKPDRDNLEKALLDAMTRAGVWRDDCQVCAGEVRKAWAGDASGGAEIKVYSWAEED